jgi:Sigma-70 region 2
MQAEGDVVRLPVAQEGPPDFATFFADEHRELFRLLCFVTGNRADAADLMQDAFLRLWERWDGSIGSPILGRTCSAWRSTGPGGGGAPRSGPRGGWYPSPRRTTRSTR